MFVPIETNFDFSPTIESLRPYFDESFDGYLLKDVTNKEGFLYEKNSEILGIILERFPDYFTGYLSHPDAFANAKLRVVKHPKTRIDDLRGEKQSYFLGEQDVYQADDFPQSPGGTRNIEIYPISKDDAAHALMFERRNPAWEVAIGSLQDALSYYIDSVYHRVLQNSPFDDKDNVSEFALQVRRFTGAAANGGFMRELSPIMAYGMLEQETEISEKSMARALCETFRRHAFKSAVCFQACVNGEKTQIVKVLPCPFGPILGKLSSVVLDYDAQGNIVQLDERRPGALFYFLYQRAQTLLGQKVAPSAQPEMAQCPHHPASE